MSNYNFDVKEPVFDENGIAKTAGWLKVYNADGVTGEYIGANYEYVAATTGLAAGSYRDMPQQPPMGYAVRRSADKKSWEFVKDYRNKRCYSKADGRESTVASLGELDPSYTFSVPATPFDEWVDDKWVTNLVKRQEALVREETQKRQALIDIAERHVNHITSAVKDNAATEDEAASLDAWTSYLRALNRIDTTKAPVEWPKNEAKFFLPGTDSTMTGGE